MNKAFLGLVVMVVLVGVVMFSKDNSSKQEMVKEVMGTEEKVMQQEGEVMMKKDGEAMMKNEGEVMIKKDDQHVMTGEMVKTTAPGMYTTFDTTKLALAETGKVVLFFKASWCPSCIALDADLKKQSAAIPLGVTVLSVDYDKSQDLKKKYGVTSQHTLVQVDKDGNLIKKWNGGSTLASVVSELK